MRKNSYAAKRLNLVWEGIGKVFIPNAAVERRVDIWVLSFFPSNKIIAWSRYTPIDNNGATFVPEKFVIYSQGQVDIALLVDSIINMVVSNNNTYAYNRSKHSNPVSMMRNVVQDIKRMRRKVDVDAEMYMKLSGQ